jgi:hypothetical protein
VSLEPRRLQSRDHFGLARAEEHGHDVVGVRTRRRVAEIS